MEQKFCDHIPNLDLLKTSFIKEDRKNSMKYTMRKNNKEEKTA